jgi:hypothetical protein
MMEITLEEIQKKFESLPEDLKWAIMAANVDDNIIEIGQKEGLNVEQMGQLSLETHMVMFGFTHPDKFEESLKGSLKLSDEKTKVLANAVNEKILKEIREKFMSLYQTPKKEEKPTEPTQNTEEDTNTKILNLHGIEIVPEKLELATKPISTQSKEIHPPLIRKLSGSYQTPIIKTEHTLDNLTKNISAPTVSSPISTPPSAVLGKIKPVSADATKLSPSYSTKPDPYRELPE